MQYFRKLELRLQFLNKGLCDVNLLEERTHIHLKCLSDDFIYALQTENIRHSFTLHRKYVLNLPLQPKHKSGPKHSDEYPHMSRMIESPFLEVAPFHALQNTHLCSSNELASPYEQLDALRNFDLSPIPK